MPKFTPGTSGNPQGKKPGTKSWTTKHREKLQKNLPDIIDKLLSTAKDGDLTAIRLILDRTLPPLRAQAAPVNISIPTGDEAASILAVFSAMAKGEISPDAGNELVSALATLAKVKETTELLQRIEALERALQEGRNHGK